MGNYRTFSVCIGFQRRVRRLTALKKGFQTALVCQTPTHNDNVRISVRQLVEYKMMTHQSQKNASQSNSKTALLVRILAIKPRISVCFSRFSLQLEGFGHFGLQIRILQAKLCKYYQLERSGGQEHGEHPTIRSKHTLLQARFSVKKTRS